MTEYETTRVADHFFPNISQYLNVIILTYFLISIRKDSANYWSQSLYCHKLWDTVLGLKLSLNHNTQTTTLGTHMKAD